MVAILAMGYGAFLLAFRRDRSFLGLAILLVSVWVFGSSSLDWGDDPGGSPPAAVFDRPAPATTRPTVSRPQQTSSDERKYIKVTKATYEGDYATVIVQGTTRGEPIQCVVQHKLSKDYIATEVWYSTTDIVTEVIIRMPDVFSTASLAALCFELD